MEAGTTSTTLTARLPILNLGEYDLWLMRIEQYFLMTNYSFWEVILNGNKVLKRTVGEVEQEYEPTSTEEKQDRRNEMKARRTLLMALPNKDQLKFHSYKDAKFLMEAIEKRYGGNKESKKLEIQGEFITKEDMKLKLLRSLPSEWKTHALIWRNKKEIETIGLDDFTNSNCNNITNKADNTAYGVTNQPNSPLLAQEDLEQIDPDDLEEMDLQWEMAMLTIKARSFIKRTGMKLDVNGQRVGFDRSKLECYNCHKNRSSSSSDSEVDSCSKSCVKAYATLKEQYDSLSSDYKKSQFNLVSYKAVPPPYTGNFILFKPDLMFMDEIVKSENMDVITIVTLSNADNGNVVEPKTVRKNNFRPPIIEDWNSDDDSEVEFIPNVKDKTVRPSTEKIKFVKFEHLRYEYDKKVIIPVWNNSSRVNHKNFANKMTNLHLNRRFVPQAVLTTSGKINTAGASVNTAVNTVRVKDTTARDRAVVTENKEKGANAVKASACWVWKAKNSRQPTAEGVQGKGVIDSGCSRHITGKKCYLTEYEDYDGGFVSFRDGKGRISKKDKIKTGTLDFDYVYFCKELKYNLFSVSKICDKKNNVLFTDTECLVLSSDFKLHDESQVLLRVPRKDNIYSVDLKSVVPIKGLTRLFAKAAIDESSLWHWRLGRINFKNMNKLIRGNFVRGLPSKIFENDHSCVACQKGKQHKTSYYKVKVIRSDNGTEFKNSVMNQFCKMKGIKREFSIARTPQQNGVAERRNRTLIEASRTRLVQERFQDHPLKGQDLLLWGDLRIIFDPDKKDEL
ncbi:ribonuclease H-like domain-containing protein [Tanacetum coccineum]